MSNGYFYNPSIPLAVLFAVFFGIALAGHSYQLFKYKTFYMAVLIVALVLEFEGYIFRVVSTKNPDANWATILSQVGLIVAPAFLAAQSYMIVGRMMSFIGPEYSYINHNKITGIFVASDVFAILTQAGGGAMLAGKNSSLNTLNTAKKILLGGLALQVITFGIFLFVAISFHWKSSHAPALQPYVTEMARMKKLWVAFYISGILITIRSIYRTAEFGSVNFEVGSGSSKAQGYALTHEWLMYVFDSIPILISVIAFMIAHPGMYLPSRKGMRIDGKREGADDMEASRVQLQPLH